MMIMDNSTIAFDNNTAKTGEALYFNQQSNFTVYDFSLLAFNNNTATLGGAFLLKILALPLLKEMPW